MTRRNEQKVEVVTINVFLCNTKRDDIVSSIEFHKNIDQRNSEPAMSLQLYIK